jgi:hypothetical protein
MPQTQDSVPAQVLMACGADYPTYVLNPLAVQKPFDGRTQRTIGITGGKNAEMTVALGAAETPE